MGQHPSVHRAAFFLEAPFPSLSWFLGGLVPGLGSFFFSNNSASSDRSSSLTFPSDWNWKRLSISKNSGAKEAFKLGSKHPKVLKLVTSVKPLLPGQATYSQVLRIGMWTVVAPLFCFPPQIPTSHSIHKPFQSFFQEAGVSSPSCRCPSWSFFQFVSTTSSWIIERQTQTDKVREK